MNDFIHYFYVNLKIGDLYYRKDADKEYGISSKYFNQDNYRNLLWLVFTKIKGIKISPPYICFKMDDTIEELLMNSGLEKSSLFQIEKDSFYGKWNGFDLWQKIYKQTGKFLYIRVNQENINQVLDLIVNNKELWKEINA